MTASRSSGILPCQSIEALIQTGAIACAGAFGRDQVQPASLDLRLGERAWRVRASFLPGKGRTVSERMADVAMHRLDLTAGAVLERGCVYIAEVQERLALPAQISARANPKSSTGRVDVFVRLLTDHSSAFDDVAPGYAGPLYVEIAPQTFSVLARSGTRLNQLRLKRGSPPRLETQMSASISPRPSPATAAAATPGSSIWTGKTATTRATSGSRWSRAAASCCWTPASSISWRPRRRSRSPPCRPPR